MVSSGNSTSNCCMTAVKVVVGWVADYFSGATHKQLNYEHLLTF